MLRQAGYIAMSGQIVDASLIVKARFSYLLVNIVREATPPFDVPDTG